MKLNNLRALSLKLLISFSIFDPSGDYLIMSEVGFLAATADTFRILLTASLIFSIVVGVLDSRKLVQLHLFPKMVIIINAFVITYSLLLGMFFNDYINAIRECVPFLLLALIPTFYSIDHESRNNLFIYFIKFLILICFFKIVIAQLGALLAYGVPSWKVFLKISPVLIVPYAYYLQKFASENFNSKTIFILSIVIFEILIAQARALMLAVVLVSIFILIRPKRIKTLVTIALVILLMGLGSMYITGLDYGNMFGIWSGEHFDNSADYRVQQFQILIERFSNRPLLGFGFGYYTSGYGSYGELEIPYQLELDLLNFASKTGIIIFSIYLFGYILMGIHYFTVVQINLHTNSAQLSSMISIFAFLFYSIFQTYHSSILYWLCYSFFFTIIFSIKGRSPSSIVLQNK